MKYIFSFLLIVLINTLTAQAQVLTPDFSLSSIPENPDPSSQVSISVQSYSVNLNQTTITWKYNGSVIASGLGKTSITLISPAAGKTATVSASMTPTGFDTVSASLILRPGSIDMLWEAADAYVPPFYKGKALLSTNGLVRVTAIPSVNTLFQSAFTWTRSGSVQQQYSGVGKQSFSFSQDPINDTEDIGVSVENTTSTTTDSVSIVPTTPSLVAYLANEGFIDYANGSTTTISTSEPGAIIRFEPYYFSTPQSVSTNLAFNMSADGQAMTGDPEINELRISRPENVSETAITVGVSTIAYTLQHLTRLFTLRFN